MPGCTGATWTSGSMGRAYGTFPCGQSPGAPSGIPPGVFVAAGSAPFEFEDGFLEETKAMSKVVHVVHGSEVGIDADILNSDTRYSS